MSDARRGPRVEEELTPLPAPVLQDDAVLETVAISGEVVADSGSGVEIRGSKLTNARLIGVELDRLRMLDTVVQDSDLSGAVFSDLILDSVSFVKCRMSGTVLSGAKFRNVGFSSCKLDGANFRMISGEAVRFDDCVLIGADFYGAILEEARFFDCDLSVVEFSKSDIKAARLHGSRLDDVKGAGYLKGITIDSTQVLPLALPLFQALGIRIDDDREGNPETQPARPRGRGRSRR